MSVLDTHAWLWWVDEDPRLSDDARAAIEGSAEVLAGGQAVNDMLELRQVLACSAEAPQVLAEPLGGEASVLRQLPRISLNIAAVEV